MWRLYRKGGIEKLLEKPRRYALAKLSSRQICELQNYLREFGAETLDEVGNYIHASFDVSYTRGGLSIFCRRLRIRLKTARPSNEKKQEAAVAAYKKTLAN
jgi:transposase